MLASKGHEVMGVDLNPEFVHLINEGRAPVLEPRLQELIDMGRSRLRATMDLEEATLQRHQLCDRAHSERREGRVYKPVRHRGSVGIGQALRNKGPTTWSTSPAP